MDKLKIMDIRDLESILPRKCVNDIAQSGDNAEACEFWLCKMRFTVSRRVAVDILGGYGAWERKELQAMPMNELKVKLLWIAAWNAKENRN